MPSPSRWFRALLPAAVIVMLVAGCGSGSGDPSSSAPRPTLAPITSERPDRPESSDAVAEGSIAPTVPPVTEPPATAPPEPAGTVPEEVTDDGGTDWWVWALVALAVIAVVSGLIALVRRSPKPVAPPEPGPPAEIAAVLDQCDAISTHVVALAPSSIGSVAAADAARLAALLATVEQLLRSTPDAAPRQALASLDASMRSLHAALDAIALVAPAPLADADVTELKARATALHSETSLTRATVFPPPSATF